MARVTSQSGRDDEPREGIVLPSNGEPWDPRAQPKTDQPSAGAPSTGQPWGQPWGPEQGAAAPSLPPAPHHGELPQQPTPPMPAAPPPPDPHPASPGTLPGTPGPGQPFPPGPPHAGGPVAHHQQAPSGVHGAPDSTQPPPGPMPLMVPHQQPPQGPPPQSASASAPLSPDAAATELIPPVVDAPAGDVEATAQIRALPQQVTPARPSAPPVDNEGATELIPPVRDADVTETRPTPAVAAPGQAGDPESTTQIRAVPPPGLDGLGGAPRRAATHGGRQRQRRPQPQAGPQPRQPVRPETGVESTQALPSVPGGGVSSDFDNLFRSASTPQAAPVSVPAAGPQGPGPGRAARRAEGRAEGRRRSPAVLVSIVVVACAVVGLAAGAALSGAGEDDPSGGGETADTEQQEENGEGTSGGSGGEGGDTGAGGAGDDDEVVARQQAEDLSELLKDSNNSRDSVIRAVDDIKSCKRLPRAARDLRAAADQRTNLVDRLEGLELDQLPDNADLSSSLTEAWEASAEADEYYAAWADEARADRDVCRGNQASHTDNASQGDVASGTATQAKEQAAELWNPIAREYGLPERAATQL